MLAAAEALGYIRDRMASGLHSRRSGSIGLVVPTIDNAIFSGLIGACSRRLGLEVPAALSVVGIGDFAGSEAIEPGLTTVRLPARRIGRLAADALVERIGGGRRARTRADVLIGTELLARASTGPPPRRTGRRRNAR